MSIKIAFSTEEKKEKNKIRKQYFFQKQCIKNLFHSCGSFRVAHNGKRLCDGGFYAQSIFKTAIAKPVLYECGISRTTLD